MAKILFFDRSRLFKKLNKQIELVKEAPKPMVFTQEEREEVERLTRQYQAEIERQGMKRSELDKAFDKMIEAGKAASKLVYMPWNKGDGDDVT